MPKEDPMPRFSALATGRIVRLCFILSALGCIARGDPPTTVSPLGAVIGANGTTFRVWAPFVDSVAVKVKDGTPADLTKEPGHADDDATWTATIAGVNAGDPYRFVVHSNGAVKEYNDPRAKQLTGAGADASSVVVDLGPPLASFQTPALKDCVIYELHPGTFNRAANGNRFDFAGIAEKLDYLGDLGVNVIEVMPVHANDVNATHQPPEFNWGYDVTHLFAVNPAYGSAQDLKNLVGKCHQHNIAVILDVVYNHLSGDNLLERFDGFFNADVTDGVFFYGGPRRDSGFGPRPDFGRPQVRAHIIDNALMWLRDYGVDGLRWDSTINIRAFNNGANAIRDGTLMMQQFNAARRADPALGHTLTIAEDLHSSPDVVGLPAAGDDHDLGFDAQWDDQLFFALRRAVLSVNDGDRDVGSIAAVLREQVGNSPFCRVVYSENHDKVGHPNDPADGRPQVRLPPLIDQNDPVSLFARKRSTLAAAVVLTSPGVPMIFQGQENLETKAFEFPNATAIDFGRAQTFAGVHLLYHDLISKRRDLDHLTGGLSGEHSNIFHVDSGNKTLAYHRFGNGGPGDDVIVVVNFSNVRYDGLNIGFPRQGRWRVRLNSGAQAYGQDYTNGDSFDTDANPGARDGLNFNGNVGIGPYSVVILSQDP
jgi:1,4-alpha-glucan branching enzyme